jgi:hypothetical protein
VSRLFEEGAAKQVSPSQKHGPIRSILTDRDTAGRANVAIRSKMVSRPDEVGDAGITLLDSIQTEVRTEKSAFDVNCCFASVELHQFGRKI